MKRSFLSFVAFVLVYSQVLADPPDPVQEDVLRPIIRRPSYGIYLGGNVAFSSGTLITTCECEYESGSGFGPSVGAFLELPIVSELSVVGQIGYQGVNANYSDTEERLEYVDDGDFQFLEFEKNTDVGMSVINLDALLKWNVGGRALYVTAGPSIGWLVSGHINEREQIKTPGYTFATTGTSEKVYIDDEDLGEVYDLNELHLGLLFGIGYEIVLSDQLVLSPLLVYKVPVTSIATGFLEPFGIGQLDMSDWKHSSLELHFRLMLWL